jgi:hypothetical protein
MMETKLFPAWKQAAAELFDGRYVFGDVVPHEVLQATLGLPKPTGKVEVEEYESWRLSLLSQVDALTDYLLEEKQICLRNVIGEGYMLLKPAEQTAFAVKQGQKGMKSALQKMGRRLSFIDRTALSSEQAKENADALARLSFLKQQVRRARRMQIGEGPKPQIAA